MTQTQSTSTSESCLETHSSSSSTSTSGQKCPGKNCDDECDTPEPPPVRCCGENQEYSEGFTQVCMVDLCTTFEFATPKDKCPNPATVKYAAQPGCKCKKNFALTKPGQCARIGSIECPAVANKTDCRFYRSNFPNFPMLQRFDRLKNETICDHLQATHVVRIRTKCMTILERSFVWRIFARHTRMTHSRNVQIYDWLILLRWQVAYAWTAMVAVKTAYVRKLEHPNAQRLPINWIVDSTIVITSLTDILTLGQITD